MSTPRTSVKMAALAPMPSARVTITTNVNPGDLRSWRRAKQISFNMEVSFGSQRDNWIHTRGTTSRHAAGDQRYEHERNYGRNYSSNIDRTDVIKQRHQRTAGGDRTDQSNSNTDC